MTANALAAVEAQLRQQDKLDGPQRREWRERALGVATVGSESWLTLGDELTDDLAYFPGQTDVTQNGVVASDWGL